MHQTHSKLKILKQSIIFFYFSLKFDIFDYINETRYNWNEKNLS